MLVASPLNEELLKCGICKLYLTSLIYLCPSGHSFCSDCKSSSKFCNECKMRIQYRNIAAEGILQAMYLENPKLKEQHTASNLSTCCKPPNHKKIKKRPIWICVECNREYYPYTKLIEHLQTAHDIIFAISNNRIKCLNPRNNETIGFQIEDLRILVHFELIKDKFKMTLINYSECDWASIDGFWGDIPVKQMLAPSKSETYIKPKYIENLQLSVIINA